MPGIATDFKYKDHTINFDTVAGVFRVAISTRMRTFPSLASAHKAIDALAASAFEPFDVLVDRDGYRRGRHNEKLTRGESKYYRVVRVVGIERTRRRKYSSGRATFLLDDGRVRSTVVRDTPANRAAYMAAAKYQEETARIEAQRYKVQQKLDKAVRHEEAE